jgi:hypothetical protein
VLFVSCGYTVESIFASATCDEFHAGWQVLRLGVSRRYGQGWVAGDVEGHGPQYIIDGSPLEVRVGLGSREGCGGANEDVDVVEDLVHGLREASSLLQGFHIIDTRDLESFGEVRAGPVRVIVGPFGVPPLVVVGGLGKEDRHGSVVDRLDARDANVRYLGPEIAQAMYRRLY